MHVAAYLVLSLMPFLAAASPTIEVRGRVFYDKLSAQEPSFYFKSTETEPEPGKRQVVAVYSDKDGKELVREENFFEDGKLVRSVYKQNQVSEHGEVNMKDGKAFFSFTDAKGTETDSEGIVPNMILGSMIGPHVLDHWKELMAGDSIKVRYMAIERLETVGFKFFKQNERMQTGKAVVDLLMKPSSFLISAVVNPIRLTFTRDEPRYLVEVEGRTPIRWPRSQPPTSRKDWKAIDARIAFDPPKLIEEPTEPPKQTNAAGQPSTAQARKTTPGSKIQTRKSGQKAP